MLKKILIYTALLSSLASLSDAAQQVIDTSHGNDDTMLKIWAKGNANFTEVFAGGIILEANKADKINVLGLDNTDAFTPTLDTHPATKGYADSVGGGAPEGTAVLSTGEAGGVKYLREDGDGTSSWQAVAGGLKNNFAAVTYPTSDDDITQGYSVGSFWVNTFSPGTGLICTDNTAGAARWTNGVIGVKEENVSPIRKGSVLMIIRQQGIKTEVGLVDPTNPLRFRGMAVAAEDIAQNGNGFMLPRGEIALDTRPDVGGINADAGVSWVAGDDLYATADATGRWSKVRPAFGRIIRVGKCISDSAITASVFINVKENIIRNMAAAGESTWQQLGDNAGVTAFNIQDYAGNTVGRVTSDGDATFNSVGTPEEGTTHFGFFSNTDSYTGTCDASWRGLFAWNDTDMKYEYCNGTAMVDWPGGSGSSYVEQDTAPSAGDEAAGTFIFDKTNFNGYFQSSTGLHGPWVTTGYTANTVFYTFDLTRPAVVGNLITCSDSDLDPAFDCGAVGSGNDACSAQVIDGSVITAITGSANWAAWDGVVITGGQTTGTATIIADATGSATFSSAAEDFTTYTVADPETKLSITSSTITYTEIDRRDEIVVSYDKGVAWRGGSDFVDYADVTMYSNTASNWWSRAFCLVSEEANFVGTGGITGDAIGFYVFSVTQTTGGIRAVMVENGVTTESATEIEISSGTNYYLKGVFDANGGAGTYGSYTVYVYSDSDRQTLLGSSTVETTEQHAAYSHMLPFASIKDDGTDARRTNGTLSNLILGAE